MAEFTTERSEARLTLLFDTRNPEEVEALHYWRAAFGPVTDIEAVNEDVFALHISPGAWCWEDPGETA